MGCSNSYVIENETNLSYDLKIRNIIKKKIMNNPFYSLDEDKYKEIIFGKNDINSNINSILKQIASKVQVETLIVAITENVLLYSKKQLQEIYPNNNHYNYNILMIMYYFLTKQTLSNKESKKKFVLLLIQNTITENQGNSCLYSTGKLSFLLYNIIQFCLFSFISLFLAISLLEIEDNFDENDLYQLFIERKKTNKINPLDLNEYINEKLKKLNRNITLNNVLCYFVYEVFHPISDRNLYYLLTIYIHIVIASHIDSQEELISNSKIDEVADCLCSFIDVFAVFNRFTNV